MTVPVGEYPRHDADVLPFVRALGLPGIVDLHVHFLPSRLQRAVWRFFDDLDDPPWPVTYRDPTDVRLGKLRELGVVQHTALAYPHRPGMVAALNEFTLGLAERHPQVIPTFTLFPEDGIEELVAGAIARGGRVAKVHLQVGRFHPTDARLDEAWQELARRGIPVVLHASAVYGVEGGAEFCGAAGVAALLDRHPDLRLVIAHLGGPDFADFLRLAEQTPGLRMDTAMVLTDPPYLMEYPREFLDRLRALLPRLVFGSDYPTIPHEYAAQLRGLAALELDEAGLQALLHDNAIGLLAT